MNRRRGDGLATLSRLKQHEMESVALEMGEMTRALDQIKAERQHLLERLNERGDPDAIESTRVLSDFIRNVSETLRRKETEAQHLRDNSAGLHARLNALFADAKRLELISLHRTRTRKHAVELAETAEQNESFLSIWIEDQISTAAAGP